MTDMGSWHVSDRLHLALQVADTSMALAYIHPIKHEEVTNSPGRLVFNICEIPAGEY